MTAAVEEREQWLEQLIEYFTRVEKHSLNLVERGQKSKKVFLSEAYDYLRQRKFPEKQIPELLEEFARYIWGYHILEELLQDESISDIKVLNYNNIRIKRYGKRETSNVCFSSREAYRKFIEYVAAKNKTSVSDIHAVQSFTDKTGNSKFILRFNISTEFINSVSVPYLHIRQIPKNKKKYEGIRKSRYDDGGNFSLSDGKGGKCFGNSFFRQGSLGKDDADECASGMHSA